MARSKQFIVDVIIGARSDAPVVLAAEARFGSHAFDTDFADVSEQAMREWYDQYLDDRHAEDGGDYVPYD